MKETKQNNFQEREVNITEIENFFQSSGVVERVLSAEDLKEQIQKNTSINIMMGQTFDSGQPVDMLKYGLFIMNLSDFLENKGIDVKSNWLLADHFITDINQDAEYQTIKKQMDDRVRFLQKVNKVYKGKVDTIFSSELCQQTEYQKNLDSLLDEVKANDEFASMVLEAVPSDRRKNPNAARYPLEELSTIQTMHTDIKVGPTYEIFYDQPARGIAETIGFTKYTAIHLKKSYPFGIPESENQLPEEVEKFGILPYKINSKGLEKFRIDVFGDIDNAMRLIYSTIDQRSLLDLINIATMSKLRLSKDQNDIQESTSQNRSNLEDVCSTENNQLKKLRVTAFEMYKKYIYEPLNNENVI
jgi:G:T/U-mismatch repair DNA glycosylase